MSASRASATNVTGRTSSSIPLQQLGANSTDSQAASDPPPSSPTPPTASGTSPQALSPSSVLASTAPLSTASPLAPSCSPNQASAPRNVLATFLKTLGTCATIALAILGVYYAAHYGGLTLAYARWTQRNDFRDGCISNRDHGLPLSTECSAEFTRTRVSAMTLKIYNASCLSTKSAVRPYLVTRDTHLDAKKPLEIWISRVSICIGLVGVLVSVCIEILRHRSNPAKSPASLGHPSSQSSKSGPDIAKSSGHKQVHIQLSRKPRKLVNNSSLTDRSGSPKV